MLEEVRKAPDKFFPGCFDISHHNGQIDWTHIPSRFKLVFIKASQGASFIDPMFHRNLDGALAASLMVVPYHFLDKQPVEKQLHNFASATVLAHGTAVMLDWEADDAANLPSATLVENVIESSHQLIGRLPLVYRGIYTFATPKIKACPWHVPKYGLEPLPETWLFWQDTQTDRSEGIGNCDHDFFNGTEAELVAWYKTGALPSRLKK